MVVTVLAEEEAVAVVIVTALGETVQAETGLVER